MARNRHVKYMFFANIFVNIEYKEMIIENNIVVLIKIHKSNSIHFLSKWHSFWEFWCQSWHIFHITLIQWTSRKVNVNIGVRIRGFFSIIFKLAKIVPHMLKNSESRKKTEIRKYFNGKLIHFENLIFRS